MSSRDLILTGLAAAAAVGAAAGCSEGGGAADAAPPDAVTYDYDAAAEPYTISQSGLYANTEEKILAPGVRPFEPRFELWSDGSAKERWVELPDGGQIDNRSGDFWVYPEGTRLWKEFSEDGMRLETRLLYKSGPEPGDWYMMSYVWDEDERDAVAAPEGAEGVRGTEHDVPSQEACAECHEPMYDGALGFSGIQLDRDPAEAGDGVTLDDLLTDGELMFGTGSDAYPHYPIPGDDDAVEALGYLHANCAGCHNERSNVDVGGEARPEFIIATDEEGRESVESTPTHRTTVGVTSLDPALPVTHIEPGEPEESGVYLRMTTLDPDIRMPPLSTRRVDEASASRLAAWIESLDGDAAEASSGDRP